MKKYLIIFTFIASSIFAQTISESERTKIFEALENQRIAWNNGDLEGYMNGYWNSDSLKFIGKRGVQYGWNATLENYRKGYPTKEAMGKLSFEVISLEGVGNDSAFMIGKWKLDYPNKPSVEGHFTLLYRKINGEWLVVADHSS